MTRRQGFSVGTLRDLARYYGDRDLDNNVRALRGERGRPDKLRPAALRLWLEAEADLAGFTLADLLATVKPGRLAARDRMRYDLLADRVYRLRARGATLTQIGTAIERGASTVNNLETRGRAIERQRETASAEAEPAPCKKHSSWRAECPACLRTAPERTPAERPTGVLLGVSREDS